ncbi:MAG: lipopolysaccharide biosynthesis protein RfbH [Halobacteriovoraceae bacterium]|nr:lipopolysaccharide biosynthesis protein RfbH [Halobacteriovoraceae bacterium]
MSRNEIKNQIFDLVEKYYMEFHHQETPSLDRIPYAGRNFDQKEMINLIDSALDFWLTEGKYCKALEDRIQGFLGVKFCHLVNSGSSANLIALSALTSPTLEERRIQKADEVIVVAASFPTTINPILQIGAVPVFVDIDDSLNLDSSYLSQALSPKTKAVMIAHTLGSPFNFNSIKEFCELHNLWLIEDNCDAFGAKYDGKMTGSLGDISTLSFYPSHHITTGEGGAVITDSPKLSKLILSFRDWGRDCWCPPGKDNTCGKRFSQSFTKLPDNYDHKYIYSHIGYNLKMTDMQASIGVAQIEKLKSFVEKRIENWFFFHESLKEFNNVFLFPKTNELAEPSWFGFYLELKKDIPFRKKDLIEFLEKNNIQTRQLFSGNITRQPMFDNLELEKEYRIASPLKRSDQAMDLGFWFGVNPSFSESQKVFIISKIKEFLSLYGY